MLKLWAIPRSLGGMCCGRLLCLIVLAGLAVVTGFPPPEGLAQTVDPQSLVGEWVGTWFLTQRPQVEGQYNMTVTKVEGNQVHGRVERTFAVGQAGTANFAFVGTLEGDKLVFTGSATQTELTINGTQMRGVGLAINRFNISMTKRK